MTLGGLVTQAYPSPEWAVFFEVGNSTGWNAKRHADAVALGIWPSRGHAIVGFEFKEDRRDWLRELKQPEKADEVAAHCDAWWLVIGAEGIAKPEELPEPWGLYVANKDRTKLKIVKQAQPFPDRDKRMVRRSFASAMLRRVSETTVPRAELNRLIEAAVQDALHRSREGRELESLKTANTRLQGVINQFKTVTGVNLEDWRGTTRIIEAVSAILSGSDHRDSLKRQAELLECMAKDVRRGLAEWPTDKLTALHADPVGQEQP